MCRNVLLAVVLCSFVVGCGQPGPVDSCQGDADCDGILVCVMNICVVPERDGGTMSSHDSGTSEGPDASVEVDAGVEPDAGVETDAGEMDAGATCVPSVELCNGIDDDCDGFIDNMAMVSALDAGVIELDGGQALSNGLCTIGVGACASTGMTSCAAGALTCSAMPSMPGVERCNGIDDDCDGQTDENDPGICGVTGQVCNGGTCACPSGQSVCNGECKVLTAEICDGLDNDCNGQVDEGVTITCLADGDNDGYATSATTSQQCADTSRAAFGSCPLGYVAPSASPAMDCQPTDGARYRLIASRADADADTYCSGTVSDDCVGTSALPGRRFASGCAPSDDCDDTQAARWRLVSSRADADNDAYCSGPASNDCVGSTALAGRRFAASCNATDDACDNSANNYQFRSVRVDADGDSYCVGATMMICIGASAPQGTRLSSSCAATDDCADSTNAQYRWVQARADGDGDGYCAGPTYNLCVGAALANGMREASMCSGTDCRDTNPNATNICGYTARSASKIKACGLGVPGTNDLVFDWTCPVGFHLLNVASTPVITHMSGPDVATESIFSIFGTASGTITVRAVCRPAALGEEVLAVDYQCEAD